VRVLFRGQVYEAELAALAARRGFSFVVASDTDGVVRELPRADALWITPSTYAAAIPQAVAAHPASLRWVALTSAGYDAVVTHGMVPGAVTTYASGVYGPVVAEHALALLLASVRQLPVALERQRAHTWDRALAGTLRSIEDMTVAIVGFGAIGTHLARCLRPLGARIVGVSRNGAPDPLADAMFATHDLHAALAESDAVVLAVTLSDETRGLIDAAAFGAMRPGTVVVNVARGGVVDGAALRAAIASGTVRGAGLDVTDPEPLPAGDVLWDAPESIVTPHVGGFGSRAVAGRLVAHFDRNIDRLLAGEPLAGTVAL
jgi:phosphoglycerate dehydrogenase-like enzyme